MDARSTSVLGARRLPVPPMWRELARFVRQPRLPAQREPFGARAIGEVAQLWVLDVIVSGVLVVFLGWLSLRWGVAPPTLAPLTRLGPVVMMLVGALALPVVEECLFRGWLDGRRRSVALIATTLLMLATLVAIGAAGGAARYKIMAVALFAWLVVGGVIFWRMRRGSFSWFIRVFPALYYASALLFGLAHISNYDLSRPWLLLPFVLPQTIAGLIFGYARIRYGMWANVALHATSNGLFLSFMLAGF